MIAWFGYPEASEFDAEHAIQAGLALVRAVPKLRVDPKVPLRARAGIASGLAVIRNRAAATERAQTVAGEASSLAAVLLPRAPADTVLIAASTRRLVRGLFEQRAFEPVPAQGFTEPIEAWQVTDRNPPASRFLALRAPEVSPLVGRDEELDLLLHCWEHASAGRGRLVLVSGEPGIGKSRLLHAFEQHLLPETAHTLRYFCSPHRAERAFFAVIEQLERAAGFLRADSAEGKLVKLETLLVAALAVSAPSVVQGQELSFSKELNSDQMACLRQLLKVSWTVQFHKEMMKIGQVAITVLNSKGLTNYIYILDAGGWCGTVGCPLLIGQAQRDGICHLLYDGMGDESFTVLQRRDHGYRRIYAPCEARFDGRQYQQLHEDCPNPHVPR